MESDLRWYFLNNNWENSQISPSLKEANLKFNFNKEKDKDRDRDREKEKEAMWVNKIIISQEYARMISINIDSKLKKPKVFIKSEQTK